MLSVLAQRTFRHLFLAQVVALLGTGLATVALGLLAFDLAGDDAGAVLGTALFIKMLAYVGVAPIAAAFVERLPRRAVLVALDLVRAAIAISLPFVTEVWQVYVLILLLQAASAASTPAFQATVTDVLSDEGDYTRALSLSRLAYDLEALLSPLFAAALLTVMSFHSLFAGTAIGFVASAVLVMTIVLSSPRAGERRGIYDRITRGSRIYLATPRLRGLLFLNLAVAAGGAMVIVNTVVLVRGVFGRGDADVALALAVFGAGSMIAALALPRLLDRLADRPVMVAGGAALAVALLVAGIMTGLGTADWGALLVFWFILGLGYSAVLTPVGRLIRRSSHAADRPAVFAAQFALSHAGWLVTYPLAGWLGARIGLMEAFVALGILAAVGVMAAVRAWPPGEVDSLSHVHADLPGDHPHVRGGAEPTPGGFRHSHTYVIDDEHRRWPAENDGGR